MDRESSVGHVNEFCWLQPFPRASARLFRQSQSRGPLAKRKARNGAFLGAGHCAGGRRGSRLGRFQLDDRCRSACLGRNVTRLCFAAGHRRAGYRISARPRDWIAGRPKVSKQVIKQAQPARRCRSRLLQKVRRGRMKGCPRKCLSTCECRNLSTSVP